MQVGDLRTELAKLATKAKTRLSVRGQQMQVLKMLQDNLQSMLVEDSAWVIFLALKEQVELELESANRSARTILFFLDASGKQAAEGLVLVDLCKELGLKATLYTNHRNKGDWGPGPRVNKQWLEIVLPEMGSENQ